MMGWRTYDLLDDVVRQTLSERATFEQRQIKTNVKV